MKRGGGFFDTVKNIGSRVKNMFKSEKPRNITRKAVKVFEKSKKFVTDIKDKKKREAFLRAVVYLSKKYKKNIDSIARLQTTLSDKIYKLYCIFKKKLSLSNFRISRGKYFRGGNPVEFAVRLIYFLSIAVGNFAIAIIYLCVALLCIAGNVFVESGKGGGTFLVWVRTSVGNIDLSKIDISAFSGGGLKTCCETMKEFIMTPYYPFEKMYNELKETLVIQNVAKQVDSDNGNDELKVKFGFENSSSSESEEKDGEDEELGIQKNLIGISSSKSLQKTNEYEELRNVRSNFNVRNRPARLKEEDERSNILLPRLVDESHPKQPHRLLSMFPNKLSAKPDDDGNSLALNPQKTPFMSMFNQKSPSGNIPKNSPPLPLANPQFLTIPEAKAEPLDNICDVIYTICQKIIRDLNSSTPDININKRMIEGFINSFKERNKKDFDIAILECRKKQEQRFNALPDINTTSDEKTAYGESVNAVILAMSEYEAVLDMVKESIPSKSKESINNYLIRRTGVSFAKFQQLFFELPHPKKFKAFELPPPEQSIERVADIGLNLNEEDDETIGDATYSLTYRESCKELLEAITNLYSHIYNIYAPSKIYKAHWYYDVNKIKIKALFLENYTIAAIKELYTKLNDETLINCISPTYYTYTNVCYILDFLNRWVPTEGDDHALNTAIEGNKEHMKDLQDLILKKKPKFKNPIVPPRGLGLFGNHGFFGGKTKRSKKQYKTKRTIKRR